MLIEPKLQVVGLQEAARPDLHSQIIRTPLTAPNPINPHCTTKSLATPPGILVGANVAEVVVLELVVRAEVLDVSDDDEESLVCSGEELVKLSSKLNEVGAVSEGSRSNKDARLVCASGGGSKVRVLERAMNSELACLSSVAVVVKVVVS